MNKNSTIDQVYCKKCFDYHNVSDVEKIKIEEEYQGYDSLHFVCPVHKENMLSVIHKGVKDER
jgi:hypothetical protein